jgi:hypothetical protein
MGSAARWTGPLKRLEESIFERVAEAVHLDRVLDVAALPVRHVEGVVGLLDLGGDARAADIEAQRLEACA